jgi:hypothetical protein
MFMKTKIAIFAALASSLLLAPLPAAAGSGDSQGHGVHCYNVPVSSNPLTGSIVYARVCYGKGA